MARTKQQNEDQGRGEMINEKKLDKLLKKHGIDKKTFIAQQLVQRMDRAARLSNLEHPCVKMPMDPVSGKLALESHTPFGPHISGPYEPYRGVIARIPIIGVPKALKRRMWIESPVTVHLFPGTHHHFIVCGEDAPVMWASCEIPV